MAGIIDETKKAVLEQNGYSVYIPWSGTKESTVFFFVASHSRSRRTNPNQYKNPED